jgi:hypothetical protein
MSADNIRKFRKSEKLVTPVAVGDVSTRWHQVLGVKTTYDHIFVDFSTFLKTNVKIIFVYSLLRNKALPPLLIFIPILDPIHCCKKLQRSK